MVRVHAPELDHREELGPLELGPLKVATRLIALPAYISEHDGSAHVAVRLTPRASREEIVGPRGSALAVKVNAPPVEDRANAALRKLVAKAVGIAPSRVQVVGGQKNAKKQLRLQGVSATEAAERLA
jgi:uncharacterized protein (TIGR00251 family)